MSFLCEKCKRLWYTRSFAGNTPEKPIVIVTPSYNNASWYQKNLASFLNQKYGDLKIIYIDDNSPDGTGQLVQDYLAQHERSGIVTLMRNKERVGALANLYNSINSLPDETIVLTVDGDDWLAHDYVCALINKIYQDSDVWLTYGSYSCFGEGQCCCRAVPQKIIDTRSFRDYRWIFSHLRTFYAGLFKKVKREDFLHAGQFYSMSWDMAFMLPMLEMAGGRFKFVKQKVLVYNTSSPLNDFKVNRELQIALEREIRERKKYSLLEKLF